MSAAVLDDLAQLAMLLVVAAILAVAMGLQVFGGEVPCPLCLIERVGMLAVCIGPILHFRCGRSARNDGLAMLAAMFLLVVSVRQVLLDICPRPGHDYVGSAVLGLHMPVWSVLIAAAILAAVAIKLVALGDVIVGDEMPDALARIGTAASLFVVALALANLVAVVLQCGFDACHTTGYKLL